jgi:uncharacterized membrane protein YbhN (UPF0104 family)
MSARWLSIFVSAAVVGSIVYYLSMQMSGHWADLFVLGSRLNLAIFVFSMQLLIVYHFMLAWLYKYWLDRLGEGLSWMKSFKVLYLSQMARFLPGGVWGYVGQVYWGSREGVPKGKMILASIGYLGLNALGGTLLALFFYPGESGLFSAGRMAFLLAVGALVAMAFFPVTMRWIARRWYKEEKLELGGVQVGFLPILFLCLMSMSHWVLYGVAFWVFLFSLQLAERVSLGRVLGALVFSGVAGQLFPVPGGIGVREGVLSFFLRADLGPSDAIAVSILSRVWLVLVDLICFFIALYLEPWGAWLKKNSSC